MKIYVGQTSDLKARMSHYKRNDCKTQKIINSSISKYGWENHKVDIIEECDINILNEKEMYWIGFYKSNICKYPDENGMNLTDGGDGIRGYKHSDETKEKIRQYNYNKSPETIEKIRQSRIGLTHSQEWKDNHSKFMMENPNSGNWSEGHVPWNKGKMGYKLNIESGKRSDCAKEIWNKLTKEEKIKRSEKVSKTRKLKRGADYLNCKCENCGKEFHRKPSQINKHVYCSFKCRNDKIKKINF